MQVCPADQCLQNVGKSGYRSISLCVKLSSSKVMEDLLHDMYFEQDWEGREINSILSCCTPPTINNHRPKATRRRGLKYTFPESSLPALSRKRNVKSMVVSNKILATPSDKTCHGGIAVT